MRAPTRQTGRRTAATAASQQEPAKGTAQRRLHDGHCATMAAFNSAHDTNAAAAEPMGGHRHGGT